jgi:hypothetical protein
MHKQKTPKSIPEIKKRIFQSAWIWLCKQSIWLKILIAILIIFFLLVISRMNFIGEPWYRISGLIIPLQKPALFLNMDYTITDAHGTRAGKKNDLCHNGDYIDLSVSSSDECWLTLFCLDSKGIHPLFNNSLEPKLIRGEKFIQIKFNLDTTIGNEVYYAIAARKNFSFEKIVKPNLGKVNTGGKGPDFGNYRLNLSRGFVSEYFGFKHEK